MIRNNKQMEIIFKLVSNHIEQKSDSLIDIKKYEEMGLEGWLKVESLNALRNRFNVKKVGGPGADFLLELDNKEVEIELKGMVNFDPSYIGKGLSQADYCLFLADGDEKRFDKLLSYEDVELVDSKFFGEENNKWIVAMIKKRSKLL